ncbi:hypothetical protein E4T56_gene5661 [Termitomyces sp. T112]|nr:hypothetical protein E4T56_gene5661 [Termitomyces sp. T112]
MAESTLKSRFKSILQFILPPNTRVIPTLTSRVPATACLSSATNRSFLQRLASRWTHGGERALEAAIPLSDLVSAAASGIPIAGAPLKGIVGVLLEVLKAFDQNRRNKDDIENLRMRLERLKEIVSEMDARGFHPPRDTLNKQLSGTERKLREEISKMHKARYQRIAELLEGCCNDIDNHLQEYLVVMVAKIQEAQVSWSIYLVDAMGNQHQIPMGMTRTFEQFKRAIGTVYIPNSPRDTVHRQYLEADQFHLGINSGKEILDIQSDYDMQELIKPGCTVMMSVLVGQPNMSCPICGEIEMYKWDDGIAFGQCRNPNCHGYIQRKTRNSSMMQKWNEDFQGDLALIKNIYLILYVSTLHTDTFVTANHHTKYFFTSHVLSKHDPVWIVKRTRKTPGDPAFMQPPKNDPLPRPPKLPKSLKHTLTPIEGFPEINMMTPPWFNLLPDQRAAFEVYPEPKLWIRDWQASKDTDLMATSDCLKELITRMTGEQAKLSTPQPEKEIIVKYQKDKQKPPYHFLISGISDKVSTILAAFPIISTPEATACILLYSPPLPRFLCSIEGFTLSIRNEMSILKAEETVMDIVQKGLSKDENLVKLVKAKIVGDNTSQHNLDPATNIILGIKVKLARGEDQIDQSALTRPRKPVWNIFFKEPPPIMWTSYFTILQHIRKCKFIDMDCGSATLVDEENSLHCNNCKGADHNSGQCGYNVLEGWYGSKPAEEIKETAEFVTSSRQEWNHAGGGNQNDRRADNWRFGR